MTPALTRTDDGFELHLQSHLPQSAPAAVQLGDEHRDMQLPADDSVQLAFQIPVPAADQVQELPLTVTAGDLVTQHTWWVQTRLAMKSFGGFAESLQIGECLRGQTEVSLDGRTLAVAHWTERSCGNVSRKCLFMHPPYNGGVGYVYGVFEPITLPSAPPAAFRCTIGKGDGSDPGDGVLFRVAVVDEARRRDGRRRKAVDRTRLDESGGGLVAVERPADPHQADRRRRTERQFIGRLGMLGRPTDRVVAEGPGDDHFRSGRRPPRLSGHHWRPTQ